MALKPELGLASLPEPEELPPLLDQTENEDGSIDVTFGEKEEVDIETLAFEDNILMLLEEDTVKDVGARVVQETDEDLMSRSEFIDNIVKGLDQLGVKIEEFSDPFSGACAATSPLIIENAVKFEARAIAELFPPGGPVKSQILGVQTPEKEAKAKRIKKYMNFQLTEEIPDYFELKERGLLITAIAGNAFTKAYRDTFNEINVVEDVPIQNFVVNYNATSLWQAQGYTHIIPVNLDDYERGIESGLYGDVDLGQPKQLEEDELQSKLNRIQGISLPASTATGYQFYERHYNVYIPEDPENTSELAVPYICTVEKSTQTVVAVRRNWKAGDKTFKKKMYFTHFKYAPGPGFYGLGLIHLIGNLTRTATAALRSLVDSGMFANMQGGFKLKSMRVIDNTPIGPGEWRDVEAGNADISKAVYPLPYKEPSKVLFELLTFIVSSAQKFADTTEQVISDSTNYGPVGTTLALLEASTKFFSGIHKRLHKSQKDEFRILFRLNSEYLTDTYPYQLPEGEQFIRQSDFDGSVEVIPVSDPNISSAAHRIMLATTQLQMAQQAPPGMYNLRELHRRILSAMDVENIDQILPPPEMAKPQDPLSDIMAASQNKAIAAFPGQDHDSHIAVKSAFLQDPANGANPIFEQITPILTGNIREHVILKYQEQIMGVMQAQGTPPGQNPDVMGKIMSEAAKQVLQMNQKLAEDPAVNIEQAKLMLQMEDIKLGRDKLEWDKEAKVGDLSIRNRELDVRQAEIAATAALKGADIDMQMDTKVMDARAKIASENIKRLTEVAKEDNKVRIAEINANSKVEAAKAKPKPPKPKTKAK